MVVNCNPYYLTALMNEFNSALIAMDITCGTSSELYYFPQTKNLPGLHELHGKALVPMSYHLVTGRGGTRIMLNGQCRYTLVLLAANCLFNTLEKAQNIKPNLELMRQSAPPEFQGAINTTELWSMKTIDHTRSALSIVRDMAGPVWPKILEDLRKSERPPASGGYGEYGGTYNKNLPMEEVT